MENNIRKHQLEMLNNIQKGFTNNPDLTIEGLEVYSLQGIKDYKSDLSKSFHNREISEEDFEKAMKDLSRLAMRKVTDKNGHQRIVYVKVTHDEKGNVKEKDFDKDDRVVFHKDGEKHYGKIQSLKFSDKTDKVGTAIVSVNGKQHSVSLSKLSHSADEQENDKKPHKEINPEGVKHTRDEPEPESKPIKTDIKTVSDVKSESHNLKLDGTDNTDDVLAAYQNKLVTAEQVQEHRKAQKSREEKFNQTGIGKRRAESENKRVEVKDYTKESDENIKKKLTEITSAMNARASAVQGASYREDKEWKSLGDEQDKLMSILEKRRVEAKKKEEKAKLKSLNIIPQKKLKEAALSRFGVNEKNIVPEGKHSHSAGYKPIFKDDESGLSVQFDTGQTYDWDKGGSYTQYILSASNKPYKGKYSATVSIHRNKNNYTNDSISSKWPVDEEFDTFVEAKNKILRYLGLPEGAVPKIKKSIDEEDLQKAFNKLGTF